MLDATPNFVDLLGVAAILLYAINGSQRGWLVSLFALLGFGLALLVGLTFYAPVGRQLVAWTPLPHGLSKPAAFLLLWWLADAAYGLVIRSLLAGQWWRTRRSPVDRLLGMWPGAVRGLLVTTVLLTIAAVVPFPGPISAALEDSRLRQALQPRASGLADQFSQVFGEAVQDTIGLLTVKPESTERVNLRFVARSPAVDAAAEARMLQLVNAERTQRGLRPLQLDERLRESARDHSRDMFERGYFAHISPDGLSPFDRMRRSGARFGAAGENLALAPTVEVAHNGLMNSPGHRENILRPIFGRLGIGVQDGGLHGKMFTQNFAD
jgi:uncharacterized protein YkwD